MRPRLAVALLAAAFALLAPACGGGAEPEAAPREAALRALFVGNSLIATNDLPGVVAALADGAGSGPIEVETVAPGGVSLEEHWSSTGARERLEAGGWDAVVLQQGPSSLPASRAHLRRWVVRWAGLARSLDVVPALMTVWPETARAASFPATISSYAEAARASGARLLPAGDAWRRALEDDPELGLYGSDGLHPSEVGTALAALVVFVGLTETPAAALPDGLDLPGVDSPETARLLHEAASAATTAASGS
ncbi:MAG TPA: SGNH/GDSL hydrolase family protein [Planctomycetota bacterium]|nr:SGNH/GDSL hydrolase family protein [Planctomycetota bacterium]